MVPFGTDEMEPSDAPVAPLDGRRLAAVEAVPVDETRAFTIERDGESREVLLTRLTDGTVAAWENHCQHWIDVRLDKGGGALVRDGEIVCRNHGAMFEKETGRCTWGPCVGAVLDGVAIERRDGVLYLDEPGWRVVGPGVGDEGGHDSRGGLDL